jgi:hypothetical protein
MIILRDNAKICDVDLCFPGEVYLRVLAMVERYNFFLHPL